MLSLNFEGWFQCRLATDPDPSDEPRGVSGWTFAVAGEPDLDRIIRLQGPVAPRSHGPTVGVRVRALAKDGAALPDHPLIGAAVELLDGPKFEGRNGVVAEDAQELIHPFHLRISGGGVVLRRRDLLDAGNADNSGDELYLAAPTALARRQPVGLEGNSAEVAEATGVTDYAGYRRERSERLRADRGTTDDPIVQTALDKRLAELGKRGIAESILGFRLMYRFPVRGPADVIDEQDALGGRVFTRQPWAIEFWVGGWDADALCGYLRGRLDVPFVRATS